VSVPRSFAVVLGELRRAAGLTQLELAERAHIGVRTLRDLETGRAVRPQRSTVDLLAGALDLGGDDRVAFMEAARGRLTPPVQRPPTA
jgi:transcriptional regulator with XRE-family HTH domain